jgi:hypothetical protein
LYKFLLYKNCELELCSFGILLFYSLFFGSQSKDFLCYGKQYYTNPAHLNQRKQVFSWRHNLEYVTGLIMMSGFRRDVDENCTLLGYYATSYDNCIPTFRDNVSVRSSRVKSPRRKESRHRDIDSIREGARGVVISKRGDSQ